MKSAEIAGNPQFWGVSPSNDIIISQKHHILTPENEMCNRFHAWDGAIARRRCHGRHVDFAHLRIFTFNL